MTHESTWSFFAFAAQQLIQSITRIRSWVCMHGSNDPSIRQEGYIEAYLSKVYFRYLTCKMQCHMKHHGRTNVPKEIRQSSIWTTKFAISACFKKLCLESVETLSESWLSDEIVFLMSPKKKNISSKSTIRIRTYDLSVDSLLMFSCLIFVELYYIVQPNLVKLF